jgi:hypothetical protein
MPGIIESNISDLSVRDTLVWFLDLSEQYARTEADAENGAWILRELATYRRAASWPADRDVLRALEKLLIHARSHALGRPKLLARIEPFVAAARAHRARLGGPSLLHDVR